MTRNKFFYLYIFFVFIIFSTQNTKSETIILSVCDDKQDQFLKNEYILNLDELIMTRNYDYKESTYQKYRITDLSVKKKNTYVRNIYEENGKILTHKHGYPQFYTQIFFEKKKPQVFIKTVLNNEEGISIVSNCKKIETFGKES